MYLFSHKFTLGLVGLGGKVGLVVDFVVLVVGLDVGRGGKVGVTSSSSLVIQRVV